MQINTECLNIVKQVLCLDRLRPTWSPEAQADEGISWSRPPVWPPTLSSLLLHGNLQEEKHYCAQDLGRISERSSISRCANRHDLYIYKLGGSQSAMSRTLPTI